MMDLAEALGIDLFELWEERFSGVKHEALMREHEERVLRWNTLQAMKQFEGTLDGFGQVWREREKLRRERIKAKKAADEYDFPDEILQIALRSLDANGAV
jgi:hypothetical protein